MATTPATATAEEYGIDDTIDGYTIETATGTKTPIQEQVHDQHNAVVKEIKYDQREDLAVTLRGSTEPTAATFDGFGGAGKRWIIDSVENAGSYNGLRRWNVKGHFFLKCNTVTDITSATPSPNSPAGGLG